MPAPRSLRAVEEVVAKLGAKAGFPALRIGAVAKYDRPLEHLCGQLDVAPLRLPLRARDGRYGLVLCFSLEGVDPPKLARELVRATHPRRSDLGRGLERRTTSRRARSPGMKPSA